MALHGDIRVNRHKIGSWSAVRKEQVGGTTDDPYYRYECQFFDKNESSDDLEPFSVVHRYNAGARVLASLVLGTDGVVSDGECSSSSS